MAKPKEVTRMWVDGEIPFGCFLRQFLTYHHCGCSIQNWVKWHTQIFVVPFVAEHSPWFLRKRLFNWLAGREHFHDLWQSDRILSDEGPIRFLCVKW